MNINHGAAGSFLIRDASGRIVAGGGQGSALLPWSYWLSAGGAVRRSATGRQDAIDRARADLAR